MKKKLIILSIVLLAIGGTIVGGPAIYKKIKYEECYVKITEDALSNEKDALWKYNYKLNAYDKDGKQVPVKFGAKKELKLNSYLRVDVHKPLKNDENEINGYEEVTEAKVPEKVKEKLDVKQ
ncbi:MAG: YxeA family protein [Clostridiaceae bacterium]